MFGQDFVAQALPGSGARCDSTGRNHSAESLAEKSEGPPEYAESNTALVERIVGSLLPNRTIDGRSEPTLPGHGAYASLADAGALAF
jgi:hypothetical protein